MSAPRTMSRTERPTPLLTAALVCFGLGLVDLFVVFGYYFVTGNNPPLAMILPWLLLPLGLLLAGAHLMSGTRWWAGVVAEGPEPVWDEADRARLATLLRRFRWVAIAEAVTWAGLLTGMVFKYLVLHQEIGVKVFGPIHGAVFTLYVLVTLWVAAPLRWGRWVTLLGLVASVPPLGTVVFERWVIRREPVRQLTETV